MDSLGTDDCLRDLIDMSSLQSNAPNASRWVHPDERTCAHCVSGARCWGAPGTSVLPANFSYRSGWNEDRLHHHLRGIVGQICGNFQHNNREINARHVQAERRRRDESGEGNEWDAEVN